MTYTTLILGEPKFKRLPKIAPEVYVGGSTASGLVGGGEELAEAEETDE